ncbi:heparinase II/III family protein [Paenibacillus sp. MSJ-34]|uniref:heparinase II/III family protein n=1 Tax=Paenibacillus sp. MSJ-34 TaxID=2841529 RepID=UPI001C119280|nr:heparinase II/III family protein [Paenibacillus sp. MSJ-34]MBU5442209.1 heparinase II/III family protein [Paenibacillus sp. MSJ-34]
MNARHEAGREFGLFALLDLDAPGLERAKEAVRSERYDDAYAALHRHMANRTSPTFSIRDEDKAEIAAYVKQRCTSELDEVMRTADEVVRQTFVFRFPWDMERTHIPVSFDGSIDWEHVPFQDVEWAYMLNRHRYWIALGQAYALTGDERYAETFCRQLEHWIDRNPVPAAPTSETKTWRSIEAGLRCSNWIKAFRYVKDSPHMTPRLAARMLLSLHEHAQYIAAAYSGWKRISNWGVLENSGLFELSLFVPEFAEAAQWRRLSMDRLRETALVQVMEDGVHWEQSPTYHHEVLLCYLDVLLAARNNGIEADPAVTETVRRMCEASLYWAKPNHRQPMLGDSDNSDVRSILTAAAIFFRDSTFRFGGNDEVDFDNAWQFGTEGIRIYESMPARTPSQTSYPFEYSGNYVMRSGWSEQDAYLHFHCGHLGGGHGHADMLHIDIHAYGRDLLTDLGRYSYSDHTPLRRELKRCGAHNTTVVDGIDFTEIVDTWQFGRIAKPAGRRWISTPGFDYAEASHDGYRHLDDPVYPLRRILFVKPHYWVLIDSFAAKREHTYTQYFHFAPGSVRIDPATQICQTEHASGANLCVIPVQSQELQADIGEGVVSYEYNRTEPNRYASYSRTGTGPVSIMQVLYPQRPGETGFPEVEKVPVTRYTGEPADDAYAEACKIRMPGSDEEHIVVVCHQTPSRHIDSVVVEGVQIFGEVVLVTVSEGRKRATVVK